MLKKLAKRIHAECKQADDYVTQAYNIALTYKSTADLFITLASEEITHAEKLIREGQKLLERNILENSEYNKGIWDWEISMANECMRKLKYEISQWKN